MEIINLQKRIDAYKRKYYLNLLAKGLLLSFGFLIAIYIFYIFIEHTLHSGSGLRAFLFYSYMLLVLLLFARMIFLPVAKIFYKPIQISDEHAAGKIGKFFPSIKDKLLNIIQLHSLKNFDPLLVEAGIKQKTLQLGDLNFTEAINFKENKKYLLYLLLPFLFVFFIGLFSPGILTESTKRIIHYKTRFADISPFHFRILNPDLHSFKDEDFILQTTITGSVIPGEVFIVTGDKKMRIIAEKNIYTYTFRNTVNNIEFHFEAAGYSSENYLLAVNNRPNIRNFKIHLNYPAYLRIKPQTFSNIGNFQIPHGTIVHWDFETSFADSVYFEFENDSSRERLQNKGSQKFEFDKKLLKSDNYEISLINEFATNKDKIKFHIDVIPDEFPSISLNRFQDTVLYQFLILGGIINDDHGFNDLRIFYKVASDGNISGLSNYLDIPITPSEISQNFYFHWNLDSLMINQSDQLEYYIEVRDNDGINGPKSSRTGTFIFKIPSRDLMQEEMKKSSQNADNQLDKNIKDTKNLQEQLEEMDNRLKGKKQLEWQDRKMIEDLIKKKDSLEQKIRKFQELVKSNTLQTERFGNQSERIKEKQEQLQKLMDELMDEDADKLYDELNRLLEQNKDLEQIKDLIEKLGVKEKNLYNNLDRFVELLKRMKYESKLDETISNIKELTKQQDSLSDQSGEPDKSIQDLSEKQNELNEEFKEVKKDIEELLDLNQDLKSPYPVENTIDEEKNIEKEQQNALNNLQQGDRKNATKSQKKASDELQKLEGKMENMQMSGDMESIKENLDNLRDIVDNLLHLSFDQERLMTEIRKINLSDPRYNELSKEQLNLKDKSKIIEDSLLSLASRVSMISSFVTRKLSEMDFYIDESTTALKERKKPQATGMQQFAMTSMNDLALLLEDVLKSMQQQLATMMGVPSKKDNGSKSDALSKMQEELNQQINELKKSGKSGRAMSEEISKLAAEQERIRNQLKQESEKNLNKESGDGGIDDIIKKMEQTELDLVNKNITQQLINRQKEIMTRLLESEKAMREQELDKTREAERAKNVKREIPSALLEYLKLKDKEIELLKTVPPKLNPYYKKEVNEYFKRLQFSSK